jgi:hypothetical protein
MIVAGKIHGWMLKLKGEGLKNKNIFIESNSIFLS